MNNLNQAILEAIETDQEFNDLNAKNIKNLYKDSATEVKDTIDAIFINLCGYSLETLLNEGGSDE